MDLKENKVNEVQRVMMVVLVNLEPQVMKVCLEIKEKEVILDYRDSQEKMEAVDGLDHKDQPVHKVHLEIKDFQ